MVANMKCPEGHTRVWGKGTTPSRTGPKTRYVCVTCGRTFYKTAAPPVKASRKSRKQTNK